MAAMKQKEVDERAEMTDTLVLSIIDKMVKQRKGPDQAIQGGQSPRLGSDGRVRVVGAGAPCRGSSRPEVGAIIGCRDFETSYRRLPKTWARS